MKPSSSTHSRIRRAGPLVLAGAIGALLTLLTMTLTPASAAGTTADQPLTRGACDWAAHNAKLAGDRDWGARCVRVIDGASPTASASVGPTSSPTPSASASPTPTDTGTPSPSPTITPTTPASDWPGAGNTGVPVGTPLTPYAGPCTITQPTTINAVTMTNCGTLFIDAPATISRSRVVGIISEDGRTDASLNLVDSEVDGGQCMCAAVSNFNVTVLRSNVHGAAASVQCSGNCSVTDSWLHGQYAPSGVWHDDAFITNGGNNMTLTHNTLACDDQHGACSGDGFLAADFAQVTNVTFQGNLFKASPNVQYCTYGGANRLGAANVHYIGNVFERGDHVAPAGSGEATRRCGKYGATDILGGSGFVWQDNTWDDGGVINPGD